MSMNLYVCAKMDAVLANGKSKVIIESFELWQTPTKATRECLNSADPKTAYANWVKSLWMADRDSFADEHIRELEEWLKEYSDWKIEWYEM